MARIYFSSADEAIAAAGPTGRNKFSSYGTIIFVPEAPVIDFGVEVYPSPFKKKDVCPQILLVQMWTDGLFGFAGGRSKSGELPLSTVNREFAEETGTVVAFTEDDFLFSHVEGQQVSHMYGKVTHDRDFFRQLLVGFHGKTSSGVDRDAYVDEIFSLSGLPLFVEGPPTLSEVGWGNNVWGLPRYLVAQGHGLFTPTIRCDHLVRFNFILVLLKMKVIDMTLMERIFLLSEAVGPSPSSLPSFEDFLNFPGVRSVL